MTSMLYVHCDRRGQLREQREGSVLGKARASLPNKGMPEVNPEELTGVI